MDRRQFVTTSAAVAGATLVGNAFADSHKHHDHGKKVDLGNTLSKSQQKKLIASTADCLKTGRECLNHCTREFAKGSTMMAECHAKLLNTLAACEALNEIAHQNTIGKKALKAFVKGCRDICQECHDECEKHAKMHEECKACMKSCKECIEVCNSIIG